MQPCRAESGMASCAPERLSRGLDRVQVGDLEPDIGKTISGIINDLRSKKYSPVPYEKGSMPKFNEANEWRKLSLPGGEKVCRRF